MGQRDGLLTFAAGAVVGVLGSLVGLGGAEFRLPVLIGLFGFAALPAVILNKAMSLVVVVAAVPARLHAVPFTEVAGHWPAAVNLLTGSLLGAWAGASWATRMKGATLHRLLAVLLVGIAAVLVVTHLGPVGSPQLPVAHRLVLGVLAGFGIGLVAALMGVAGGELLIPTLVLLYGLDIKAAGSVALLVSLPTLLVGFARYSRDPSFSTLRHHAWFAAVMAAGSVLGTVIGGQLLDVTPSRLLVPLLAGLLVLSAARIWRHR